MLRSILLVLVALTVVFASVPDANARSLGRVSDGTTFKNAASMPWRSPRKRRKTADDAGDDDDDSSAPTPSPLMPQRHSSGGDDDGDGQFEDGSSIKVKVLEDDDDAYSPDTPESLDFPKSNSGKDDQGAGGSGGSGGGIKTSRESTLEIKAIWRSLLELPPSPVELEQLISPSAVTSAEQNTTTATTDIPGVSILTSQPSRLRANGTHFPSLKRQILAQFCQPLTSGNGRAIWLEPQVVLSLKGVASLAILPEQLRSESSPMRTNTRAVKLTASPGTYIIQQAIAHSLSQSLGSAYLTLGAATKDDIFRMAASRRIPSHMLTSSSLLSALFELANELQYPLIINLVGKPKWIFDDDETGDEEADDALQVLQDELSSSSSKVFFIMTMPHEVITVGTSVSAARDARKAVAEKGSTVSSVSSPPPSTPNPFFGFQQFLPPSLNTNRPESKQEHRPDGQRPASTNSMGDGLPLPPSGRSFQVVVNNGTITMIPMPGDGPMGGMGPAGMGFPGRMPPPEVMARIMAEHSRMMRGMQQQQQQSGNVESPPGSPGTPGMSSMHGSINGVPVSLDLSQLPMPPSIFNPGMSEEEMQEAMRDPDNAQQMKAFLDKIMETIQANIPPGTDMATLMSADPSSSDPRLEVKVHMMSMPMLNGQPPTQEQMAQMHQVMMEEMRNNERAKGEADEAQSPPFSPPRRFPFPFPWGRPDNTQPSQPAGQKPQTRPSRPIPVSSSETRSKAIISAFEEVAITPPRDQVLHSLWERIIDHELERRIGRLNKRQFLTICNTVMHVDIAPGVLGQLKELLSSVVLSREEVMGIIKLAVRLEAGRRAPTAASSIDSIKPPTASDSSTPASLTLSYWALDAALCSYLRMPMPQLGRPLARSKEEINALITDKHEKSLVGNVVSPADLSVSYDMIGGLHEVKEVLRQCITYPLKYPRLYKDGIAAEAVKGVLLFGPPGTGKTMLAKAVATEGGATFLTIDASTIENKWLGESEKNAKAVFTLARRLAPCVIYLDEVDSILSSREHGDDSSHGTLTSVKTTLMQEWDGLRTTKDRVVVIASTNRPFDLDEAVLRRLPRRILVDLPDLPTRTEILSVTLADNRLAPDVNLTAIAKSLEGYSGSDIREVCREAVVRVSHERAKLLDGGMMAIDDSSAGTDAAVSRDLVNSPLRAVCANDFTQAAKKLKASVADNGREIQKVSEWNEKYGEVKKSKKKEVVMSGMYI